MWILIAACAAAAFRPETLVAREVPIVILHTADVGGHVLSLQFRDRRDHLGGLLRCATLVDRIREANPHVLLVDCGGLFDGSAESLLSRGRLPIRMANSMGYDARAPDSSEFALEPALLIDREAQTRIPMLVANLRPNREQSAALPNLARWCVKDSGGVRIVLIGVTGFPETEAAATGFAHESRVSVPKALRDVLRDVRSERPDILVLLAHGPSPADGGDYAWYRLARDFPEFDLMLFGGGSQGVIRGGREGSVLYAQAGNRGQWVGRVDILYDTVDRTIVRIESDAIQVGPDVAESEVHRRDLGATLGRIQQELDVVVGHAARDIGGSSSWPGQSPMQELLSQTLQEETEADVVLLQKSYDGVLSKGAIEYRDVLRAIPDLGRIAHLRVPASDLRMILAENAMLLESGEFLGAYGVQYAYHPDADLEDRIRDVAFEGGSKPHGRLRLHVVCDASVLSPSNPGRDTLRRIAEDPMSRLSFTDIDTRKLVIDYILDHNPVDIRAVRRMSIHSEPE